MILHGYYRSSTSYRVRIALNLKGIDYKRSPIDLRRGEQKQKAFLSISPYGSVPALETEERTLFQSLAILDWLELNHPNPSFLPSGREAAQNCRELYYAVATDIHAVNNLPVLKHLRSTYEADQAALEAWNAKWIHRAFEPIEKRLGDINWLSKELPFATPGLFEIVLVPQMYNARRWNVDLSAYTHLCAIDETCSMIKAFVDAHPDKQSDTVEST